MSAHPPKCGDAECRRHRLSIAEYARLKGEPLSDAANSSLGWRARSLHKQIHGKPPKKQYGKRHINGNNPVNVCPCGILHNAGAPCVSRELRVQDFLQAKSEPYDKRTNTWLGLEAGKLHRAIYRRTRERRAGTRKGTVRKFPLGILEQAYARLLKERGPATSAHEVHE